MPIYNPPLTSSSNSTTDNTVARWDGETGSIIQSSVVSIDDSGNVSGVVNLTSTGQYLSANGTEALPSYTFTSDPDTGIYRKTTNSLGFVTAGVEQGYITSGGVWNFTPNSGGTVELGSTDRFMDFAGTVTPGAATSQLMRTNIIWSQDVNRTSIFSINNNNVVGGSATGLTLTNLIANRSANQATNSIGVAITNSYNYDAPAFSSSSSGTVTLVNEHAFRAPNTTFGATLATSFYSEQASGTGKWGVYINGSARNYMNGGLSIGTTNTASGKLHVMTGQVTGSVNATVFYLQSAATNDDVFEATQFNRNTTTSGTAANCGTIPTTTGFRYSIEARVRGVRTGGTGGTAGDWARLRS